MSVLRDPSAAGSRLLAQPLVRLADGHPHHAQVQVATGHTRRRRAPAQDELAARAAVHALRAGQVAGALIEVSPGLLCDGAGRKRLLAELEAAGPSADAIWVQVPEAAVLEAFGPADRLARGLLRLGCRFVLQDAGFGYVAVQAFKLLPIAAISIDTQLVTDTTQRAGARALTRTLVEIARERGVETIAAGVDTPEAAHALRCMGVHHAVGDGVAAPLPLG